MKRITIICLACILILACSKNNLPNIFRRDVEPPSSKTELSKDFVADADRGKSIFENRCDRCHGLHEPIEFKADKWKAILTRMAPRARLSAEQTANVWAYLKEKAAK